MTGGRIARLQRVPLAAKVTAATTLVVVVAIGIATVLAVHRGERGFKRELRSQAVSSVTLPSGLWGFDASGVGEVVPSPRPETVRMRVSRTSRPAAS